MIIGRKALLERKEEWRRGLISCGGTEGERADLGMSLEEGSEWFDGERRVWGVTIFLVAKAFGEKKKDDGWWPAFSGLLDALYGDLALLLSS